MNVAYKTQTTTHATLATLMFAPISKAMPLLNSYHVTGDAAGSLIKVYGGIALMATVDAASPASGAKILNVKSTTGWVTQLCVAIHASTGVMEFHTIASVQAGVSITTTANLGAAFTVGDRVYALEMIASLPCAAATVSNYGNPVCIAAGAKNGPLVITVNGTTLQKIHEASVVYVDGK